MYYLLFPFLFGLADLAGLMSFDGQKLSEPCVMILHRPSTNNLKRGLHWGYNAIKRFYRFSVYKKSIKNGVVFCAYYKMLLRHSCECLCTHSIVESVTPDTANAGFPIPVFRLLQRLFYQPSPYQPDLSEEIAPSVKSLINYCCKIYACKHASSDACHL